MNPKHELLILIAEEINQLPTTKKLLTKQYFGKLLISRKLLIFDQLISAARAKIMYILTAKSLPGRILFEISGKFSKFEGKIHKIRVTLNKGMEMTKLILSILFTWGNTVAPSLFMIKECTIKINVCFSLMLV